jgi:hypothetical protein
MKMLQKLLQKAGELQGILGYSRASRGIENTMMSVHYRQE